MIDRPDKATLLDALARFLMEDVRPVVADPAVSYRLLIAANLASTMAREVRTDDERDDEELARLQALLPGVVPKGATSTRRGERRAAIADLNQVLVGRLRDGTLPDDRRKAAEEHVRRTLLAELSVLSPRFDTSPEIE